MQVSDKPVPDAPATFLDKLVPWLPLVLFGAGLLYILPMGMYGVDPYDEGVIATGAQRVLDGDVPYRDFWTLYPPGQFYLAAGLMKVFGASLAVIRVFGALEASAVAVFVFLLAKRVCRWEVALVPWLLAVIWMPTVPLFTSNIPATLCIFASFHLSLTYFEKPAFYKILFSGALCGLAGVFRQDAFVYSLASFLIVTFATRRFAPGPASEKVETVRRPSLGKSLGLFAAGVFAGGVVPAILLLGAAPFSDVWRSLVMFPLTGYRGIRASAYPSFSLKVKKLTHYLPFVFILAAIAVYALRRDRRKRISAALFVPLCALAGLLAIQNLAAAGWPHLTGALMAGLVLAGFVVESFWPSPKRAGKVAAFAFSLLFLVYIGCGWVEYRNKHIQGEWAPPGMERVGALKVNVEAFAPVVQVVDYLHGHTQERTGLFVGCPRYDIIYINDVVLYFLADRPCACRYEELHHGIATTSAVQQEIIRDLEDKRTPYVVIWSGAPRDENLVSSGIFDLQRYIERHYAPEAEFGDYEVLKRLP